MRRPRTRMALLAARGQLDMARLGEALLEQKREALLRELYREVRLVFTAHEEVEAAAAAARIALEAARVRLGAETVSAAASAAHGGLSVDLVSGTVMGVPVPAIESHGLVRAPGERGRAPEASGPALELAAERFEEELTLALRLASMESRVRRLAREIRRTSSRVNALRTRVIPELDGEVRAIEFALEQREREDRHRRKSFKRLRAGAG